MFWAVFFIVVAVLFAGWIYKTKKWHDDFDLRDYFTYGPGRKYLDD